MAVRAISRRMNQATIQESIVVDNVRSVRASMRNVPTPPTVEVRKRAVSVLRVLAQVCRPMDRVSIAPVLMVAVVISNVREAISARVVINPVRRVATGRDMRVRRENRVNTHSASKRVTSLVRVATSLVRVVINSVAEVTSSAAAVISSAAAVISSAAVLISNVAVVISSAAAVTSSVAVVTSSVVAVMAIVNTVLTTTPMPNTA